MNKNPYEAWNYRKSNVSHLQIFGCFAYALASSQARQKLDEKSEKCILLAIVLTPKHIDYVTL